MADPIISRAIKLIQTYKTDQSKASRSGDEDVVALRYAMLVSKDPNVIAAASEILYEMGYQAGKESQSLSNLE